MIEIFLAVIYFAVFPTGALFSLILGSGEGNGRY
jgi:hypothetical protein